MGRVFEYRRARKSKHQGDMVRVFTGPDKEITIAVKADEPDPGINPRLRVLVQMAKKENMPREDVEHVIKKTTDKDSSTDYKEMNYEGYGPYGIAILVETVTDDTTRTIASVCNYFNKFDGSLRATGSLESFFDHRCILYVQPKAKAGQEGLIPDLTDYGAEDIEQGEKEWVIGGDSPQNGAPQAKLEELGFEINSVESIRIPKDTRSVSAEGREELSKLIERLEEDEDAQSVSTNMEDGGE